MFSNRASQLQSRSVVSEAVCGNMAGAVLSDKKMQQNTLEKTAFKLQKSSLMNKKCQHYAPLCFCALLMFESVSVSLKGWNADDSMLRCDPEPFTHMCLKCSKQQHDLIPLEASLESVQLKSHFQGNLMSWEVPTNDT